jgi:hypothetical protein
MIVRLPPPAAQAQILKMGDTGHMRLSAARSLVQGTLQKSDAFCPMPTLQFRGEKANEAAFFAGLPDTKPVKDRRLSICRSPTGKFVHCLSPNWGGLLPPPTSVGKTTRAFKLPTRGRVTCCDALRAGRVHSDCARMTSS